MAELVGIRFQPSGKIYYFETVDNSLTTDDMVIVETNRGKDLGKVVIPVQKAQPKTPPEQLKPVIRKASADDLKQYERQQKKNDKTLEKCREFVTKLNLPMKPISAHHNIDGSHVVIFFIADKRVDFRELVKELSHELKCYVEFRQVGARDETKLIGGMGKCGLQLCCRTFLSEFSPVSIKMAKEQNITLNPMKTSGLCGRLLCCLGYEFEQYKTIKENMPQINQTVTAPLGQAKIINTNPLKQTVWVQLESGATVEYPLNQIKWQKQAPRPEQKKETNEATSVVDAS
jgi:cell fate regulator YaaT (PSP1 superfamily)